MHQPCHRGKRRRRRRKAACGGFGLFTQGMEYGLRALGARSILINPGDKKINDSVNKRLSLTEFMPFAPFIREERADGVF